MELTHYINFSPDPLKIHFNKAPAILPPSVNILYPYVSSKIDIPSPSLRIAKGSFPSLYNRPRKKLWELPPGFHLGHPALGARAPLIPPSRISSARIFRITMQCP